MNNNERDSLIVEHLPLVGYLVSDVHSRATHLDRDELASVAQFALFQASRSFDPDRGVPFGGYARIRIVGALADHLRSEDWVSRGTRKRIKQVHAVSEELTASLGRPPSDSELATVLGCSRESVSALLQDAHSGPVPLDRAGEDLAGSIIGPEESAQIQERNDFLRRAVDALPPRQRLIIGRIYFEGDHVGDIAKELGVSHSAVALARRDALQMLQEAWYREFDSEHAPADLPTPAAGTKRHAYLALVAAGNVAAGRQRSGMEHAPSGVGEG